MTFSLQVLEDWIEEERARGPDLIPNRYFLPVNWRESSVYRAIMKSLVGDDEFEELMAEQRELN